MSMNLTQRQRQCIQAIRDLTIDGVGPSHEELRVRVGLMSKANIHRLVWALKARGHVEIGTGSRSIRLVEEDLSPRRLARLNGFQLREGAAHIAGLLARIDGESVTASAYRRIADRVEHKPRVARS